jgi:adenylyltransferase/sulfurtransferase
VELHEAKVLIAGARALGAASAAHLAAAGAGYLALADGGADDGFNRAEILAARLSLLQPDLHAEPYPVPVEEANAVAIASGHDAVLDATGDEQAGRLLARAGAELKIPAVHIFRGTVLVTRPGGTACFSCAAEAAGSRRQAADPAAAQRSLLAGLMGAVAAADLAAALSNAPSEAVLRTVSLPPAIDTRTIARDSSCAVCAAVPEAAR